MTKNEGHIIPNYTAYCGGDRDIRCDRIECFEGSPTERFFKREVEAMLRKEGWRKTKEFGWQCPAHRGSNG